MTILTEALGHRVEVVKTGLWRVVFHLPVTTNCWLFEESDGLTLIDAAHSWNAGTIIDTIKQLKRPLRRIIITHAHPDHAGAARQIADRTGATVCAHENDAPFLLGRGSVADLPGSAESQGLHRIARALGILHPPSMKNVQPLVDGDYAGSLRVVHTPGHTPGSISLWSEEQKALVIGDNASNRFHILQLNLSWFTLDRETLIDSFQKYSDYPAGTLLPGHGPAHHSPNAAGDLLALTGRYAKSKNRSSQPQFK